MKVEIEVSQEKISDMLITALEGGSNYWYILSDAAIEEIDKFAPRKDHPDISTAERFGIAISKGACIPVDDIEEEEEGEDVLGTISTESIQKGLALMAAQQPEHFANFQSESGWDAETADVFFQYAVMGEIVFG